MVLKFILKKRSLFVLILLSYLSLAVGVSGATKAGQTAAQPNFVCNLMDERAAAAGIRGADLGVSVMHDEKLWLIFGDTTGPPGGPPKNQPVVGSSSAIESKLPFDCSSYTWMSSAGKFYQPLHSARKAGVDESTVPAGGITINGDVYVYSMRVSHWGSPGTDPTNAHGVLFKQREGVFTEVTSWPTDQPFVNAAPVEGKLWNGSPAVFIVASGRYRHSPVYLSYVLPQDIENPGSYHYLTGYDQNSSPLWTSNVVEAKPIPSMENVWAGELSFLYDASLKTYLLMFVDYSEKIPALDLYFSSTPYGAFHGPEKLYPCGSGPANRPQWMEKEWGGCYGGYMLPDSFGPDGHDLYFTFSLWNPYTTVIMKTKINTVTTEASQTIPSQSQLVASAKTNTIPLPYSLGTSSDVIAGAITLIAASMIISFFILKRKMTHIVPFNSCSRCWITRWDKERFLILTP